MSSESCSAWPGCGRFMTIGYSARPSRLPRPSKMPARALPVPISTAQTSLRRDCRRRLGVRSRRAGPEGRACRRRPGRAASPRMRRADRRARHASRRRRRRPACPLALAAAMPAGLSSITMQFSGATPMSRATCRKRSGAGLPRFTIEALKICGSNRSRRPVTSSDSLMRSSWLDEATQRLPPMRPSASAIPGIGFRSLRKRS